jgi:acetyl-CoA carboxylase biotin carboxyl carrier protein
MDGGRIAGASASAVRRRAVRTVSRREHEREGTAMAEEVRAEMVANVWKIVVAEGDEVADGDTLVILESMKMEIPVLTEVDGTVSKIAVTEGSVVQEGDLIAEIS